MIGRDRPENDDLLRLALLLGVAMVAATAVLSQHADWLRQLVIVVAWIHVKPFAEFVQFAPQIWNLAAVREWLLAPAVFIDENLSVLLADASGNALRLSTIAAGRAATLVYGPAFALLAINASALRCDLANRKIHDLDSLLNLQAMHWPTAQFLRQAMGHSVGSRETQGERNKVLSSHSRGDSGSDRNGTLLQHTFCAQETSDVENALRPETWLRLHGLARQIDSDEQALRRLYDISRTERLRVNEWQGLTCDALCEVLEPQLGSGWRGFEGLSHLHRALAALFALFHDFRREEGQALLSYLAALAERTIGKPLTMNEAIAANRRLKTEISAILDSDSGKRLLTVASRHAWLGTAFIGMLHAARKNRGVLPSASFIWLKHEDRKLWYALNSAGNAVALVEAAGVLAHYRAERQIRRPLYKPAVYQASRAFIDSYLDMSSRRLAHRNLMVEFRKPVGFRLEEFARRARRADEARN